MISFMMMLFACENDIKIINSLSQVDSMPVEFARDIEVYYSDSGKVQACLESPFMTRNEDNESYIEFPDGFKIVFFDSVLNPKSEITANYGISFEKKKIMEAKNNVVVKNIEKGEQLETEHLVWDRNKKTIYSEVFVKITRDDEVIYGDGLISDQNFEYYKIKNASGEFHIDTDEEE